MAFYWCERNNVGVWVVKDGQEGSSGGPFYRSLLNQATTSNQEITYIVNYGQAQTESYRLGILNHYTLVVNKGQDPNTNIDTSWFADMGMLGYASESNRGRVSGVGISNLNNDYDYTIGFANSKAQYWVDATASSGYFSKSDMLPGTYTMTVYKNELAVAQKEVTVKAGETTVLNSITINNDPGEKGVIWRIGKWDGSPQEFLNGDKLTTMHPSDVRMSNWNPSNFIVGTSTTNSFPAYIWKDINNEHIVYFKLSESELAKAHTVRVGITDAVAGGRPRISVNNWTAANPSASTQPSSRSLTTGSYRGNNTMFEFQVPARVHGKPAALEWNSLVITVISGQTSTGYLSPSISVDAVDFLK
ncbi:polysaccharide lyase family protein [Vibrio sp. PP-XX7]